MFEKFEKMYNEDKSKKFVLHLVRSYYPSNKPVKVIAFTSDVNLPVRCNVTNSILSSVNDIKDVTPIEVSDYMKSLLAGENMEGCPVKAKLRGRLVAVTGEETNTYLSMDALRGLYDFVALKQKSGDKQFKWLLDDIDSDGELSREQANRDKERLVKNFKQR